MTNEPQYVDPQDLYSRGEGGGGFTIDIGPFAIREYTFEGTKPGDEPTVHYQLVMYTRGRRKDGTTFINDKRYGSFPAPGGRNNPFGAYFQLYKSFNDAGLRLIKASDTGDIQADWIENLTQSYSARRVKASNFDDYTPVAPDGRKGNRTINSIMLVMSDTGELLDDNEWASLVAEVTQYIEQEEQKAKEKAAAEARGPRRGNR